MNWYKINIDQKILTTAGIRFILFTIFIVTAFTFIEFVFFRSHLQGFGNLAGEVN